MSEKYIGALYYNKMFYSVACWETAAEDDRELKNMNIKTSKLLSLKDNFRMRVIGLGWEDPIIHWFNNGTAFAPEELASRLKMIVS